MSSETANVEDSENFWKVPEDDDVFWEAYVSTRPAYSPSFYSRIYNYHATHSNSWNVAHDVGCGAGQVTAELATRFRQIEASDNNDTHLSVAARRLESDGSLAGKDIRFKCTKGEDLALHHPGEEADLIAVAEAMVLMDEHDALASFAKILKPGGTLAAWFYGRPTFSDPKLRTECQPLLDKIMDASWKKVLYGSEGKRKEGLKRAADGMASWLDYIDLDEKAWTNVQRIKWNPSATLPFFGEEACGFKVDICSNVKAGEVEEKIEDATWWKNNWNIATLRKYFRVLFPGFTGAQDPEVEPLFASIRDHMGGDTPEYQFTWPAVLILATKN